MAFAKAQEVDNIVQNIEWLIRKDVGLTNPIPCKISDGPAKPTTAKSLLLDWWRSPQDTPKGVLCTLQFDLAEAAQRPALMRVVVNKLTFKSFVTSCYFAVVLKNNVKSDVRLKGLKLLQFNNKFEGDAEACQKLNAVKKLADEAFFFTNQDYQMGRMKVYINGEFALLPDTIDTQLVAVRLPRRAFWSGDYQFGVKDFIEIANKIDAVL